MLLSVVGVDIAKFDVSQLFSGGGPGLVLALATKESRAIASDTLRPSGVRTVRVEI